MRLIIKGGRVIDPCSNTDKLLDLLIEDGIITQIRGSLDDGRWTTDDGLSSTIIDATGKWVTPGLIDMHVHLREPGHEYKETIETGSRAAAAGGFTAICCMPNTYPVNDNQSVTEFILRKAHDTASVKVYPIAAISKGLNGEELSEFGELMAAGAVAVTDDGRPVSNPQLMRRALEYAKQFNLPVISHAEETKLSGSGVMNEGAVSMRLGLRGIPNAAEAVMVARDILLAELTKGRLHIAHVSAKESVRLLREAKARGLSVTAETAPHYFMLTEEAVAGYNTNAKINPPLREKSDIEAILSALQDGTIDVIASDHAPHSALEKDVEFDRAASGIVGLETSLSLSLKLVKDKILSPLSLIAKMSTNPAKILGISGGRISEGAAADITIIDPDASFIVDAGSFQSRSRNSLFHGWNLQGKAILTIVDGKVVFGKE
ncbi:MAG: dihydroorotase [Pseudomonadota bacterium]